MAYVATLTTLMISLYSIYYMETPHVGIVKIPLKFAETNTPRLDSHRGRHLKPRSNFPAPKG